MKTNIRGKKMIAKLLRTSWLSRAAVILVFSVPGLASASDLTFFETQFDTDFTSEGIGQMRNDGTGDITLSDVTGTVTQAYLYWHGPSLIDADNSNVTFNGTDIEGDFLGISDDNCWSFQNSLAYRADVTSLVSGNGTYSLTNFTNDLADINGVSLIVFFDDGDDTNNRDVVLFDGNDSNINNIYDAPGWNILLQGIDYDSGDANAQFHVSDGQTFSDAPVLANGTPITTGTQIFQGDGVQTGNGDNLNGFLWDIENFDVTSLLNPGLNDLNITSGVSSDCLSCVLIAIDLPAGTAPEQPNGVPEPGTLGLLGLGLLGMGFARRRKT
jgi:hypothetical protein